ncbi:MAG: hypothetical protein IKL40_05445 [Clostridia bacterium]|nr:hypothetical protein [Clostridia bacterium]
MKKFAKLMVLALVVAALVAIFAIPSSATTGPVLYISNTGTGDGKTPQTPLGHGEGYVPNTGDYYLKNVMLQALYKLQPTGGTIVIVGPVSLDTVSAKAGAVGEAGKTAADLDVASNGTSSSDPDYNVRPTITVTSNYGGVDYRLPENGGAKLILDHAASCVGNLRLKSPGVWRDLNIEYRYDLSWTSYYTNAAQGIYCTYMIQADHTKQVFDTGITCTSVEVKTDESGNKVEVPGTLYPTILGGHRQGTRDGHNTDITVNSGTWRNVIAGGYGHSASKPGTVKGNAKVTIGGGKIETLSGSCSLERAYGTITGTVDITVTGGEIGTVYLTNGETYTGPGITLTVSDPAKFGAIYHSPIEGEILPECTVTVNGQPYVAPTDETTAPAGTDAPASQSKPVTQKPATTKAPTGTTAPVTTDDKKEEGSNLTLIIIIVVVAVVVIAAAVVVLLLIKKKKAAK